MKTLREMADEMRRSAEVIEQKAIADQSDYFHEVASGNRKIADALDAGQDAIERLAIAEAMLRGFMYSSVGPDVAMGRPVEGNARRLKRERWAHENVKAFIYGEAIEPLEDGKA